MSGREPTTILKSVIEGQGRGAKLRSKLVANKEQNWLLALSLNSFAKLAANAPLTDLEQIIVDTFRKSGFDDNYLKQQARLYQQIPEQMRSDIFPEKFVRLNSETKYGIRELKADLPSIEKAVLAQPNVRDIDVQAIHAKTASVRDYPKISQDVLKQYGSATLRAVAPDAPTPTVLSHRYTIKAVSFLCEEETSEWSPSDEPYWVFGTLGSSKISIATTSKVFNDTDAGETKTFDGVDGNLWGENGLPQDFPNGEIGCVIQLWEHDEGDASKAKAGVEAALNLAKKVVAALGAESALLIGVITAAGPVIAWLLSFFDDDLIATQNFVFTRQVIEDQLGKTGKSLDVKRRFTDGDANYVITIRVSRLS